MSSRPHGRHVDPNELHPHMRFALASMTEALANEGIPFAPFEMYRTPERQRWLGAKRPRVTRAKPWRSFHQYGCAVDFVLRIDGRWSWSQGTEEHRGWWRRLQELGDFHDLDHLSFEKPHLQLRGVKMSDLRAGRYPSGGDDLWAHTLLEAAQRFPRGAPKVLPDLDDDRELRPPVDSDGLEPWLTRVPC